MNRGRDHSSAGTPLEARGVVHCSGDALKLAPSGHLRPSRPMRVEAHALPVDLLTPLPLRPKAGKARPVDRLERQERLKTCLGGGVDVPRSSQTPHAMELCPIALKADRAAREPGMGRLEGGTPLELRAASRTQRPGAFALQLPAWERNPFSANNLRLWNGRGAAHAKQSSPGV